MLGLNILFGNTAEKVIQKIIQIGGVLDFIPFCGLHEAVASN